MGKRSRLLRVDGVSRPINVLCKPMIKHSYIFGGSACAIGACKKLLAAFVLAALVAAVSAAFSRNLAVTAVALAACVSILAFPHLAVAEHRSKVKREYPLFLQYITAVSSEENPLMAFISGKLPQVLQGIRKEALLLKTLVARFGDLSKGVKAWYGFSPSDRLRNFITSLISLRELGLDERYYLEIEVRRSLEELCERWSSYGRSVAAFMEMSLLIVLSLTFTALMTSVLGAPRYSEVVWSTALVVTPFVTVVGAVCLHVLQPLPKLTLDVGNTRLLTFATSILGLSALVFWHAGTGDNMLPVLLLSAVLLVGGISDELSFRESLRALSKLVDLMGDLAEMMRMGLPVERALFLIRGENYGRVLSGIVRDLKAELRLGRSVEESVDRLLSRLRGNELIGLALTSMASSSMCGHESASVLTSLSRYFASLLHELKGVTTKLRALEMFSALFPPLFLFLYTAVQEKLSAALVRAGHLSSLLAPVMDYMAAAGGLAWRFSYELALCLPLMLAVALKGRITGSVASAISLMLLTAIGYMM